MTLNTKLEWKLKLRKLDFSKHVIYQNVLKAVLFICFRLTKLFMN